MMKGQALGPTVATTKAANARGETDSILRKKETILLEKEAALREEEEIFREKEEIFRKKDVALARHERKAGWQQQYCAATRKSTQ